eukprot:5827956-Alexandrium_andersonii.AAC.1
MALAAVGASPTCLRSAGPIFPTVTGPRPRAPTATTVAARALIVTRSLTVAGVGAIPRVVLSGPA